MFQIGDRVKVVGGVFQNDLYAGAVSTVLDIWQDQEYPYELLGFVEHVRADEIALTTEELCKEALEEMREAA